MSERKKDAWMTGGDLKEKVVEDVPEPGQSVRVRALPAFYSNQAIYEALEMHQDRGGQTSRVNLARLAVLRFAYGVIDPVFTVEEAESISKRFSAAFDKVVDEINELSGVDEEAIKAAEARFPVGGAGDADGRAAGDDAPAGGS